MPKEIKKVPAIEKCFAILQHFAKSRQGLGISEIAKQLKFNKSTVFGIIYTLKNLGVLEQHGNGKFQFGTLLYLLGNANGQKSELIQTVHPYLEKINRETKLSAFLGIRSENQAVILDKVDTAHDIKISSEIGMHLPLTAGAGGKALLSQLANREIDRILSTTPLKKFTSRTCVNKSRFKKDVINVREKGIAFDNEEYIDGIVALAAPLKTYRTDLQAAIWTVGLKQQAGPETIASISDLLIKTAKEINQRFIV